MDVWKRNSACDRKKNVYHEVEEFICNSCRFDHKEVTDWVIEGPRKFDKDSVINQNNYTRELDTVHIATEEGILKVENRKKKLVCLRSHWVRTRGKF
jgi:NADH-quinone oxidoreductase subunit G